MKFTDGQRLLRPGVVTHYATEVYSAAVEGATLVVHAAVRPIRSRLDTQQGPLPKITLSSPARDVIRVRIEHSDGVPARWPAIPIATETDNSVDIVDDQESASLSSSDLTAVVAKKEWGITFRRSGRPLTTSGWRGDALNRAA
jgi:alpha-D-xyloside xylohydrolase